MFNVIIDTREQQPWILESSKINKCISRKLDTGDYTIEGLEDKLCIERKKSVSELAGNLTSARFEKELERMSEYEYNFLLLEFSISDIMDYPIGSKIPKKQWRKIRVRGPFIMSKLARLSLDYGTNVWYCGCKENAEAAAIYLMKQVYESE